MKSTIVVIMKEITNMLILDEELQLILRENYLLQSTVFINL